MGLTFQDASSLTDSWRAVIMRIIARNRRSSTHHDGPITGGRASVLAYPLHSGQANMHDRVGFEAFRASLSAPV